MSEPEHPIDPEKDPHGYIEREIWPPLPRVFGGWLEELIHRAKAGTDPSLELAIPDAIRETGIRIPGARTTDDGTPVITLATALILFRVEHLLFPGDAEHAEEPVLIFEPVIALQLANTADAATVADIYNADTIRELSAQIKAGEYDYRNNETVTIDAQGRLTSGLNVLLAIVHADAPAPALAVYDTDTHPGPYRWRGPAGWTNGAPHD